MKPVEGRGVINCMTLPTILATAALFTSQQGGLPPSAEMHRIAVYSSDPWRIVAILRGIRVPLPELSTLSIFGFAFTGGQGTVPMFPGRFMVNPTDNSIWYLPR